MSVNIFKHSTLYLTNNNTSLKSNQDTVNVVDSVPDIRGSQSPGIVRGDGGSTLDGGASAELLRKGGSFRDSKRTSGASKESINQGGGVIYDPGLEARQKYLNDALNISRAPLSTKGNSKGQGGGSSILNSIQSKNS